MGIIKLKNLKSIKIKRLVHMEKEEEEIQPLTTKPMIERLTQFINPSNIWLGLNHTFLTLPRNSLNSTTI